MNLKKKFKKIISTIGTMFTMLIINAKMVYADTIGTAEVETATDNLKSAITAIAMPLRRSFNICKCSCCSNKNDSKC